MIHNRLPTRHNLLRCQLMLCSSIAGNVLYVGQVEVVDYLVVMCKVASTIWYRVFRWVGWPRPLPQSILKVFELFWSMVYGKIAPLCLSITQWMFSNISLVLNWIHAHTLSFVVSLISWECDQLKWLDI